ncbi:DUF6177 family protein [Streptomyces sp. NPDC052042]|uniref:DUF6177 family protein n=1 Tax=Streptomyces sp. NPDC052042 TaxID=3365683 RepID=UPI0037D954C6
MVAVHADGCGLPDRRGGRDPLRARGRAGAVGPGSPADRAPHPPAEPLRPAPTPAPDGLARRHPADERLVLGGALERAWHTLTETPPVRLGPATLHYTLGDGTDLAAWQRPQQINDRISGAGQKE